MSDNTQDKAPKKSGISGVAMAAAGAIGSAALAAALLYVTKRKDKAQPTDAPAHPENAQETD